MDSLKRQGNADGSRCSRGTQATQTDVSESLVEGRAEYARRIALLRGYHFEQAPEIAPYGFGLATGRRRAAQARRGVTRGLSLHGRGGTVRRCHYPLMRLLRVGDHRAVSARDLDRVGAHPLCELPLGIWWNHLVVLGDQIPRGQ
jgi:hypothetical protein